MALLFIDGFDSYSLSTTADLVKRGWAVSNSPSAGSARFGSAVNCANQDAIAYSNFTATDVIYVGFAFYKNTVSAYGDTYICQLIDTATSQLELGIRDTGVLRLTRGNTQIAVGTIPILSSAWYYIEIGTTIADAGGTCEIRVNGVTDINFSGDTKASAVAQVTTVRLGQLSASTAANANYDDFYICDDAGGTNNTFLGDIRVQSIFPNGNGNSSQLVGSDGNSTDNYLLVDETTTPSDADYVESSTVGNKDTYTYTDLTPTTGTVYGVQIAPRAAKTDAGVRSIVSVARLSGTETDGPTKTLSTTYVYYPDVRETKPGGGSWSISDVNSAEFGVKINA